ncbi:Nif3-like dinuclear metal center hexameric protein [Liquorilactobacillus mali]|uniref:Nif3-like dinuclear metal center hexameric protein n=1 Tax=Liquorilactobacillus mali TaxID=1618 RepID=UPI002955AA9E|nr:Nif3-like dinuclear metal center hexameric protein [Liquorilactobacillus mali]
MKIAKIIEKIKEQSKGNGKIIESRSRDQVLYGNVDKNCKGIVTAIWPSVAVIEKAHKLGANFIICHESLFWNHGDQQKWLQDSHNTTYFLKKSKLDEYDITVWRLHDYIHAGLKFPDGSYKDGIFYGFAQQMGWENNIVDDDIFTTAFSIPVTSGLNIAQEILEKFNLQGSRVIGNLNIPVHKVAIPFHIFGEANKEIEKINAEGIDLLITMELNDFTLSEYVKDRSILEHKAAILSFGHFNVEKYGMNFFANYFKKQITSQVPINFIDLGDTYDYLMRGER